MQGLTDMPNDPVHIGCGRRPEYRQYEFRHTSFVQALTNSFYMSPNVKVFTNPKIIEV